MKLNAPRQPIFWIAIGIAALGVLAKIVPTLWQLGISGWLGLTAFAVLAAGNLYEGFRPAEQTRGRETTKPTARAKRRRK